MVLGERFARARCSIKGVCKPPEPRRAADPFRAPSTNAASCPDRGKRRKIDGVHGEDCVIFRSNSHAARLHIDEILDAILDMVVIMTVSLGFNQSSITFQIAAVLLLKFLSHHR
jgi:hypothetical protein